MNVSFEYQFRRFSYFVKRVWYINFWFRSFVFVFGLSYLCLTKFCSLSVIIIYSEYWFFNLHFFFSFNLVFFLSSNQLLLVSNHSNSLKQCNLSSDNVIVLGHCCYLYQHQVELYFNVGVMNYCFKILLISTTNLVTAEKTRWL